MLAECCERKGCENCGRAFEASCKLKEQLIREINALGIEDMQYTLPGGKQIQIWDDDRIYLGNELCKRNSDRCYGLTADENYLLVCEYGAGGSDAEIVVYKRRG
mgnify:CR=1 FL=1